MFIKQLWAVKFNKMSYKQEFIIKVEYTWERDCENMHIGMLYFLEKIQNHDVNHEQWELDRLIQCHGELNYFY